MKVFKLFFFFKEWVFASKDKAEGCREGKVCEIGRHRSAWRVWERVSESLLGGHSGWGGLEEAGGVVGTEFYSEVCVGTSKDLLKKDDLIRTTF